MVGNPRAAERLCDDEDDSDTVSVCFLKFQSKHLNAFVLTSFSVSQASGDFGSGEGDRRQTGHTVKVSVFVVISLSFHFCTAN